MRDTTPTIRLDIEDRVAVFRPMPVELLRHAVNLVEQAIHSARRQRCTALLVVYEAPGGFAPPSLAMRQDMMRRWARAADGVLRIAMVVPARYIDEDRFGVAAALNYGLSSNVFTCEADARAWLDAHQD
jgi:hypothetical protein